MKRLALVLVTSSLVIAAPALADGQALTPPAPPAPPAPPSVVAASQPVAVLPQAPATVVEPPQASHWYGWEMVIPDLVGVALVVGGMGANPSTSAGTGLVLTGASALTLDGVVVHMVHHRWGTAAASLAVRLAGAVLGGLVGGLIASQGGNSNADVPPSVIGAGFGFGLGSVAGVVIDDAVLAWEKVPASTAVDRDPATTTKASGIHLALAPVTGPRLAAMGLVGTF